MLLILFFSINQLHFNVLPAIQILLCGNMQIVAFAQGAPSDYQAVTISVDQPTSVQIKLDKYIVLGPFLIQATTFITIVIILFAIILFVAVEIYR
jgi:hypothetical protein